METPKKLISGNANVERGMKMSSTVQTGRSQGQGQGSRAHNCGCDNQKAQEGKFKFCVEFCGSHQQVLSPFN
jgi:hypothetical protein